MPLLRHHGHARPGMYGLARHAEFYERRARRHAGPLYRRVVGDVSAAGLAPGAVVLDVGTGPGLVPLMIAAANPDLVLEGVDRSPEMIARASFSAEKQAEESPDGRPPVRFQVADVADLPFPEGSIDLVISSISLHHCADPGAGLRDVLRVLKPGATAWIYDFRWTLRRPERFTSGLAADVRRESPMASAAWYNPIARLLVRRTG
jgi:ubiquinone/menaquinone biosynthesis C-methylase UbiE